VHAPLFAGVIGYVGERSPDNFRTRIYVDGSTRRQKRNRAARRDDLRMKKVVFGLAALLLLAVVVQFYLAATGAFDSAPTEEGFSAHRALGNGILGLAVVTTIVAAIGRMPGKLIGRAGLIAALVLVQRGIREIAKGIGEDTTAGPMVFGLHAVNGLAILGLAVMLVWQTRQLLSGTVAAQPVKSGRMAS
jgi:hypothetical protein